MKVILLNLDRSGGRLEAMKKAFPNERFVRLKGVDGSVYQNAGVGRPQISSDGAAELIAKGVLAQNQTAPVLTPGEVGCAMAHGKAWRHILKKGWKAAIIVEDDIKPGEAYNGTLAESVKALGGVPKGAHVLFLTHADGVGNPPKRWDAEGRLLYGGGNHAYVITAEGAEKALAAQFPMYLSCAEQWHEGLDMRVAPRAVVEMAGTGARSTMNFMGDEKTPAREKRHE